MTARAGASGAEQFGQNVRIDRTAFTRKAPGAEVEAEIAKLAATGAARLAARTETLELRRPRLAFRVDLAVIEGFALLVVAKNFVGGAHFGEALFRLWLLALVGVVLLGELAKRGFDFRRARSLGYAKNVIWITHL